MTISLWFSAWLVLLSRSLTISNAMKQVMKCALMLLSLRTYTGRVERYDLVSLKFSSISHSPLYMSTMSWSETCLFSWKNPSFLNLYRKRQTRDY